MTLVSRRRVPHRPKWKYLTHRDSNQQSFAVPPKLLHSELVDKLAPVLYTTPAIRETVSRSAYLVEIRLVTVCCGRSRGSCSAGVFAVACDANDRGRQAHAKCGPVRAIHRLQLISKTSLYESNRTNMDCLFRCFVMQWGVKCWTQASSVFRCRFSHAIFVSNFHDGLHHSIHIGSLEGNPVWTVPLHQCRRQGRAIVVHHLPV